MPHELLWHTAVAAFAVAAAVLLVGGWILLRFQRDRQHFKLMQTALERGITAFPGMIPPWVVSLRQGVLALVLGIGILAAGIALHATAAMIGAAPEEALPSSPTTLPTQPAPPVANRFLGSLTPPAPPPPGPPFRWNDAPPPHDGPFAHEGPRDLQPPHLAPALERWHRIQSQRLAGLVAICIGGILTLLGCVRIAFARLEKKYASEFTAPRP